MVPGSAGLARALDPSLTHLRSARDRPDWLAAPKLRALRACALAGFALILAPLVGGARAETPKPSVEGHWQGSLQGMLRLVVHVARDSQGRLAGTMDSPDQGAFGLPIDTLGFDGDSLRFLLRGIHGEFAGAMSGGGTTIQGRWHQGSVSLPLTLERTAAPAKPRRPQEPVPPLPYAEDTVRVWNRAAGVSLAGTLSHPRGKGPFACALLITGSGPEDRDETVFGHRPFLVLADHLTRHGLAVLRLDDRGVGGSSGGFSDATTEDFASDVEASLQFLEARQGIDRKRIGLIGHSEGGLIAPMVAARRPEVAFVVLLAGPGVRGDSVLIEQVDRVNRASGADEAAASAARRLERQILEAVVEVPDSAAAATRVRRVLHDRIDEMPPQQRQAFGDPDSLAMATLRQLRSPWMRFFLTYDPVPALRRLRCPVLALGGAKNVQVAPAANLSAIERALRDSGHRDFEVKEIPGLNHLFQTADTGAISEYAQIEETFAPAALDEIARWILAHTSSRR